MDRGSAFVVDRGWGTARDLDFTEAGGRLDGAEPDRVSQRAYARGADQCGTLGSGNHFLEVQVVDRVLDETAAEMMGLREGMITVLIHSGSRGLGYQVCDDHLAHVPRRPAEVRLHAARPAARLRPGRQPGGPGLPRRDAGGGELSPGAIGNC